MSNRERGFLHQNQVEEFVSWARADGWTIENTKGEYESLRLTRRGEVVVMHQKLSPTEHLTTHNNGTTLVKRWLAERRCALA
jgi:hypothetical protein